MSTSNTAVNNDNTGNKRGFEVFCNTLSTLEDKAAAGVVRQACDKGGAWRVAMLEELLQHDDIREVAVKRVLRMKARKVDESDDVMPKKAIADDSKLIVITSSGDDGPLEGTGGLVALKCLPVWLRAVVELLRTAKPEGDPMPFFGYAPTFQLESGETLGSLVNDTIKFKPGHEARKLKGMFMALELDGHDEMPERDEDQSIVEYIDEYWADVLEAVETKVAELASEQLQWDHIKEWVRATKPMLKNKAVMPMPLLTLAIDERNWE